MCARSDMFIMNFSSTILEYHQCLHLDGSLTIPRQVSALFNLKHSFPAVTSLIMEKVRHLRGRRSNYRRIFSSPAPSAELNDFFPRSGVRRLSSKQKKTLSLSLVTPPTSKQNTGAKTKKKKNSNRKTKATEKPYGRFFSSTRDQEKNFFLYLLSTPLLPPQLNTGNEATPPPPLYFILFFLKVGGWQGYAKNLSSALYLSFIL